MAEEDSIKKIDVQAFELKLRKILEGAEEGKEFDVPMDRKEAALLMRALDYCIKNKITVQHKDGTFCDIESWQVLRDKIRRQVYRGE